MLKRVLLVLLSMSSPAAAWGPSGHRVTGAIAETFLQPETRRAVACILGQETLAEASTWPDFMRADPSEFWQKSAGPWHYVTVPDGRTYKEVGVPPQGDAVSALQRFRTIVQSLNAPLAERQLALRFIVHIVGDLHQPLHVGRGSDRGGNDVKVRWFGRETNLHAVWDSDIVDEQRLSFTEMSQWLGSKITPEQARAWNSADPQIWIGESQALRTNLYPPSPDLGFDYGFRYKALMDQRLSQAGVRIAAYLDDALADLKPQRSCRD